MRDSTEYDYLSLHKPMTEKMRGKYLVATWLGLMLATWTIVIVIGNALWQLGKWVFGV